jgi:hypothetical protein
VNPKITWHWSIFGWFPVLHADGYVEEEQEPSGKDKVQALCDLAVIMGLPVEEAEEMTFTELSEYVEAKMGLNGDR